MEVWALDLPDDFHRHTVFLFSGEREEGRLEGLFCPYTVKPQAFSQRRIANAVKFSQEGFSQDIFFDQTIQPFEDSAIQGLLSPLLHTLSSYVVEQTHITHGG